MIAISSDVLPSIELVRTILIFVFSHLLSKVLLHKISYLFTVR